MSKKKEIQIFGTLFMLPQQPKIGKKTYAILEHVDIIIIDILTSQKNGLIVSL